MGTNSVDYRVWDRRGVGQWEHHLEAYKGEVSSLYRAVVLLTRCVSSSFQQCCHANVIGSTLSTWMGGWGVGQLIPEGLFKAKDCGFISTYSSFIFKKGPCKGCPMGHLFATLDKGLPLNLSGRHILTGMFRMALSPKQLLVSARAAEFKHVLVR